MPKRDHQVYWSVSIGSSQWPETCIAVAWRKAIVNQCCLWPCGKLANLQTFFILFFLLLDTGWTSLGHFLSCPFHFRLVSCTLVRCPSQAKSQFKWGESWDRSKIQGLIWMFRICIRLSWLKKDFHGCWILAEGNVEREIGDTCHCLPFLRPIGSSAVQWHR